MIAVRQWTLREWLPVALVGLTVFLLFAMVSPGDDYIRCYTWMVMETERYPQVADAPWTFNPPWLAAFMAPFVALPGRPGLIVFLAFTIIFSAFSVYYLGGKPILTLLSAHMMWILWWGQVEVWGLLALVIGWLALERKSQPMIFLALILASFKPQISAIPVAMIWWWSGRARWQSLLGAIGLLLLSLWVWGPWPVWYYQGIIGFVGDAHSGSWNASLGLAALPLFIPALLLPLDREKRLIALCATAYIVSPYMPYYSTIALMAFAIPVWAYLFAFTAYLPDLIGTQWAWNAVVLMPISVLAWLYWPLLRAWLAERRLFIGGG